ncbi:MAG: SRPBCC family protein [Sphingobium sp.]
MTEFDGGIDRMEELEFSEIVVKPTAEVWSVIGDFGALSRWAKAIEFERVEICSDGIYRVIKHSSGKVFRERLVDQGPDFYTYATERTGTDVYEATVAVKAVDSENTRIVLTVSFQPMAGVDVAALTEDISIFFRGSLRAMKRALGVPRSACPTE